MADKIVPGALKIEAMIRREPNGVEFKFTDAAKLLAAAERERRGRPGTFLPTSAQGASPTGAMR